ncbi:phage holin family protein [Serratia ureilytica]|uniref:Phage holin family protein n=1 Tax=Serratia ureilytica TaxID=300181 RepID=A0ABU0VR00_9GAMM|nr:phage holin family protein [Serratia ureilytica]MCU7064904.1 phage holin family protein [Serratia ureilytica]MDQ1811416.1 phage holin family protein [Serratia ureilytica]MDQ1840477.1 phage holin family protein [Serratia ureilytica]MDQ1863867.1 phage holin family protein [Serratia ureilytica]
MTPYSALWQSMSQNGPQWDLPLVSGVLCGALIFLLRSHEPSWPRKVIYFVVSVVGGFSMTPLVQAKLGLPVWPSAFLSSAAVVTLAIIGLDWAERTVPNLLTAAVQRLIGGTREQQNPDDTGEGDKK